MPFLTKSNHSGLVRYDDANDRCGFPEAAINSASVYTSSGSLNMQIASFTPSRRVIDGSHRTPRAIVDRR
jgi:hypothetical protein